MLVRPVHQVECRLGLAQISTQGDGLDVVLLVDLIGDDGGPLCTGFFVTAGIGRIFPRVVVNGHVVSLRRESAHDSAADTAA